MSLLKGFEHLSWSALREDLGLHDGPLDTDDGASAASPHPTDHDPFALGLSVLEPAVVVSCNKCRKSILQTAFVEHLNYCSGLPEAAAALPSDSQRISNPQPPKKRKKEPSASTPIADSPAVIPITIEDAAPKLEKPAKIAKTNQLKAKVAGQPLDLDRQCGVMSDKTGLPCARSITCKIHPVNQKRAVQGRSQTYDALILELQRKKRKFRASAR
ncbi:SCA7, zinc-binding domain-containing protein [Gaertneriomyces semiglobifer]|nr:SCA7, zinc-binding domain-containing protein [Gaertneriomyces semiglobifer]